MTNVDCSERGEPDFGARSAAYLEACAAWRARERRLGPDWGLVASVAGSLAVLVAPCVAWAVADGTGPAKAMRVCMVIMGAGVLVLALSFPFHIRRRGINPRPTFRSF